MKADREKWEARYRAGERTHDGPPSGLLRRWLPVLPKGRALDVAAGLGRNAIFLARAGYRVDAVDISPTGLAEAARRARRLGARVRWIEADLDVWKPPSSAYDLVVNTFFLKRRLIPALQRAVRPGGAFVFETHLQGDEHGGPGAAHRLRPGELQRRFKGWDILELEEGRFSEGGRSWLLGRLVARRPMPATRRR
ncbi:MAG: class I SAM-dependent methyltransferase [Armatimonadota bacterium]|nr:class I SAM-dependent methyltransferase [Armatimonadota bacterium]